MCVCSVAYDSLRRACLSWMTTKLAVLVLSLQVSWRLVFSNLTWWSPFLQSTLQLR